MTNKSIREITYGDLCDLLDPIVDVRMPKDAVVQSDPETEYDDEAVDWYGSPLPKEHMKTFAISDSDAEFLLEYTRELIYYSDYLGKYIWVWDFAGVSPRGQRCYSTLTPEAVDYFCENYGFYKPDDMSQDDPEPDDTELALFGDWDELPF